jgi:hypothetical protein
MQWRCFFSRCAIWHECCQPGTCGNNTRVTQVLSHDIIPKKHLTRQGLLPIGMPGVVQLVVLLCTCWGVLVLATCTCCTHTHIRSHTCTHLCPCPRCECSQQHPVMQLHCWQLPGKPVCLPQHHGRCTAPWLQHQTVPRHAPQSCCHQRCCQQMLPPSGMGQQRCQHSHHALHHGLLVATITTKQSILRSSTGMCCDVKLWTMDAREGDACVSKRQARWRCCGISLMRPPPPTAPSKQMRH